MKLKSKEKSGGEKSQVVCQGVNGSNIQRASTNNKINDPVLGDDLHGYLTSLQRH